MSKKLTASDKVKISQIWVLKHGTSAFTTSTQSNTKE